MGFFYLEGHSIESHEFYTSNESTKALQPEKIPSELRLKIAIRSAVSIFYAGGWIFVEFKAYPI